MAAQVAAHETVDLKAQLVMSRYTLQTDKYLHRVICSREPSRMRRCWQAYLDICLAAECAILRMRPAAAARKCPVPNSFSADAPWPVPFALTSLPVRCFRLSCCCLTITFASFTWMQISMFLRDHHLVFRTLDDAGPCSRFTDVHTWIQTWDRSAARSLQLPRRPAKPSSRPLAISIQIR